MTEKKAFKEMKLEHAMKLQTRMMELIDELRHDREIEEESFEEDDEDGDDYYDEDEVNPAQEELFLLMELYKVITRDIE